MDTKVSLSKAALVMLFHPNPDDPDGPLGTFRPIIHQIPWHADPSPDPWKARVVVRAVIDRSVDSLSTSGDHDSATCSFSHSRKADLGWIAPRIRPHPSLRHKRHPCQGEFRGFPERPWRQDRMRTKGVVEDYLHRLRNQFYPDNERHFTSSAGCSLKR